jgi:mRNA-degrading endonuclease toxin of MazEF toxin-antitoxin module
VSIAVHQWDVVRIRVRPEDRDEHPAVVMSREEWCQDERRRFINVLYGTTRRPASGPAPLDVTLNGADGLESMTLLNVEHVFSVPREKITAVLGRVTPARRRQIGRTLVQAFRLPL